ncbi:hypothetical protein ABZ038_37320, partial [Streptomyces sp. NPDC006349]|uniref:hypothetical protein n=1 Tax=Streptomyces sp. NPDC006349 TaxID=3156757 RepID=UPI0033A9EDB3
MQLVWELIGTTRTISERFRTLRYSEALTSNREQTDSDVEPHAPVKGAESSFCLARSARTLRQPPATGPWAWLTTRLRERATWRELGH